MKTKVTHGFVLVRMSPYWVGNRGNYLKYIVKNINKANQKKTRKTNILGSTN